LLALLFYISSCNQEYKKPTHLKSNTKKIIKESVIVDCHYTFEEAIVGSKAPDSILQELQLINVRYYSMDGRIHQGQLLTNKEMSLKLEEVFLFMEKMKFPVAQVIPIVKYDWNDDLSMQVNNTYSFCYRNVSYSKHAQGMAIDINPFLNPVRWKKGFINRQNKPACAIRDTTINGTFFSSHPVVQEFIRLGFIWGHNFKTKYDDHHFEK